MNFVTGKIVKGTNPKKAQTGKEQLSKILCSVNEFIFSMAKNGRVYEISKDVEHFVSPDADEVIGSDITRIDDSFSSYFGFNFGDTLPDEFKKFLPKSIDRAFREKDMVPIFVGMCTTKGYDVSKDAELNKFYIQFVNAEAVDNKDGSPIPYVNITDMQFLGCIFPESKKMVVHYLNLQGEKTEATVNDMSEITDMSQLLYKFE